MRECAKDKACLAALISIGKVIAGDCYYAMTKVHTIHPPPPPPLSLSLSLCSLIHMHACYSAGKCPGPLAFKYHALPIFLPFSHLDVLIIFLP